jgi:uncharacterized protein YukE
MAEKKSTTIEGMSMAEEHMQSAACVASAGRASVKDALAALNVTWTGDASSAFSTAMDHWLTDCAFIERKLIEMIQIMRENRGVIRAGEQTNIDTATAIPVGPGLAGL